MNREIGQPFERVDDLSMKIEFLPWEGHQVSVPVQLAGDVGVDGMHAHCPASLAVVGRH